MHIVDNKVVINNTPMETDDTEIGESNEEGDSIVEWDCSKGECSRPASVLFDEGLKFPLQGESDNYIEPERCFVFPLVSSEEGFQKGSDKKVKNYYFCHEKNLDGSLSTPRRAALQVRELVTAFNNMRIEQSELIAIDNIKTGTEDGVN